MAMTRYWRKKIGDHSIGKASVTMPAAIYAALYSSDPTDAGTQSSEITQFARVEVTSKFGAFDATTGIAASTSDINFGSPVSNDLTAAYIGFLDASSAGNMLFKERIPNPRAVINGARPLKLRAGTVTIQMV
jgi:hypothetical protein